MSPEKQQRFNIKEVCFKAYISDFKSSIQLFKNLLCLTQRQNITSTQLLNDEGIFRGNFFLPSPSMCDAFPHLNMFMSGSSLYPVPVPFLNPVSQTPFYYFLKMQPKSHFLQEIFPDPLRLLRCPLPTVRPPRTETTCLGRA